MKKLLNIRVLSTKKMTRVEGESVEYNRTKEQDEELKAWVKNHVS